MGKPGRFMGSDGEIHQRERIIYKQLFPEIHLPCALSDPGMDLSDQLEENRLYCVHSKTRMLDSCIIRIHIDFFCDSCPVHAGELSDGSRRDVFGPVLHSHFRSARTKNSNRKMESIAATLVSGLIYL